jgi:AraC-like DNA-binding protein
LYLFRPPPLLAAYVDTLCFYEGEASLHTKERRLPDGSVALVINLGHDTLGVAPPEHPNQFQRFSGGVLSGVHSQYAVLDATSLVTTISVQFKPGGAAPFLPMPASEVTNRAVELSTLWGDAAIDLREQLLAAPTPETKVHLLEHFLTRQAAWEQQPHPAVTFALASFQAGSARRSIAEVTAQLCLSPKRFFHLFKEAVGLTPKAYCRVLRFQEVLGLIERRQQASWADLAHTSGYFDQAHFIHDFQAFAGLSPSAYLAERGEHRNHVPLPD